MNATTFAQLATSANLNPVVAYAQPYGGWTQSKPWDRTLTECRDAVTYGEYLDVEDALVDVLHTAVLLAEDSKGRIVGAWSEAGWVLGTRSLGSTQQAYERVHAG